MPTSSSRRALLALALAALLLVAGAQTAAAAVPPAPGGPVLVVTAGSDPFGGYYTEILRAEGLNEFATADISQVSTQTLAGHSVVVLASMGLSDGQVAMFDAWVKGGGNLIAMRPDKKLAGLLGLADAGGAVAEGYLAIDTSAAPGAGLTGETMQFHGTADRYAPAGAATVAALYSSATAATGSPAVTLRSVGTAGGQAAAFTFDLARSVVQTRQGNPAYAGQERDGAAPPVIRSDDLFFPDFVDFAKISIPQADEQQRLLANLITRVSQDKTPLPRFWYFPRGHKAAVVMTGDDHNVAGGTLNAFDRLAAASRPGCSVADWECVRGTSYVYAASNITDAQAAAAQAAGHEIALHLQTGASCSDFTPSSLQASLSSQLAGFVAKWPSVAAPATIRTHCIPWSDWASQPKVDAAHGIRLNTDYYYWPGSWIQNRPGLFTGSGMPMRFADIDGSLIDVYQATTQITDESEQNIPAHIAALLDGALGQRGYYGAFTVNMHTDLAAGNPGADAIVAAATSRGVPVVSARQMLGWLEGRDASAFHGVSHAASGALTFTLAPGAGARGLEGMVPVQGPGGALLGLTRGGQPVGTTPRTVKGVDYAVFDAQPGAYVATYPRAPGAETKPTTNTSNTAALTRCATKARAAGVKALPKRTRGVRTFPRMRRNTKTLRLGGSRTFSLTTRLRRTSTLTLSIRTSKSKLVCRMSTGRRKAKTIVRLRWDGRDARGKLVVPGRYRYTVTASAKRYSKTAKGSLKVTRARTARKRG